MLLHKPKHMSWEEAAGIPEVGLSHATSFLTQYTILIYHHKVFITATQALYVIGEFTPGKSVLWHAGASSVSIAGIQLAKAGGASAIYATCGSDEKVTFCEKLGVTKAFNYRKQNWPQEILKVTEGKGVGITIDYIGADYFSGNLDVAARDGRIVSLGALSGTKLPAGVDISAFVRKRIRFEGSSLRSRDPDYQGKLRDRLEGFLPQFEDGTLKIFIERVFPWEEVIEAHKLMESNKTMGKLICTID
jgi:NADPH:quinone reductase-like Zn-dependent oxidoreductase